MPRTIAYDPVVTQTVVQVATPPAPRLTTIPFDPLCRQWTGDQTVDPPRTT